MKDLELKVLEIIKNFLCEEDYVYYKTKIESDKKSETMKNLLDLKNDFSKKEFEDFFGKGWQISYEEYLDKTEKRYKEILLEILTKFKEPMINGSQLISKYGYDEEDSDKGVEIIKIISKTESYLTVDVEILVIREKSSDENGNNTYSRYFNNINLSELLMCYNTVPKGFFEETEKVLMELDELRKKEYNKVLSKLEKFTKD